MNIHNAVILIIVASILLLSASCLSFYRQQVSGNLIDSVTGSPISGATVMLVTTEPYLPDRSKVSYDYAITDNVGHFSLVVPRKKQPSEVYALKLGYYALRDFYLPNSTYKFLPAPSPEDTFRSDESTMFYGYCEDVDLADPNCEILYDKNLCENFLKDGRGTMSDKINGKPVRISTSIATDNCVFAIAHHFNDPTFCNAAIDPYRIDSCKRGLELLNTIRNT